MSNIKKMEADYKASAEMQDLVDAQQKTIKDLTKMIAKLEAENKELSLKVTVLERQAPMPELSTTLEETADIEIICVNQLRLLREKAVVELTYEESKKLATYADVLLKVKAHAKDKGKDLSNLSTEELLAAMQVTGGQQ